MTYAKEPFGRLEQVLRYMALYTHCLAIANSRLVCQRPSEPSARSVQLRPHRLPCPTSRRRSAKRALSLAFCGVTPIGLIGFLTPLRRLGMRPLWYGMIHLDRLAAGTRQLGEIQ